MGDYKTILVGTDFHNDGLPVVRKAVAIAKLYSAKLHIVSVVPNVPFYMASGLTDVSAVEETLEMGGQERLEELQKELDVKAECHLVHGSAKIEISKLAKEIGADLIVIGSHGRNGVQRVLGSTSSGVLHRAKCDVMVVRTV